MSRFRFRKFWYRLLQTTGFICIIFIWFVANVYYSSLYAPPGTEWIDLGMPEFPVSTNPKTHFSDAIIQREESSQGKIRVWNPHSSSCRGKFATQKVKTIHSSRPILMLREALVDLRHQSLREFELNRKPEDRVPFARIAIQISTAFGVEPVLPPQPFSPDETGSNFPQISLVGSDGFLESNWGAEISYVIENPYFHAKMGCSCRCWAKRLNVSVSTSREEAMFCIGRELQMIVTIFGPETIRDDEAFQTALDDLERTRSPKLDINMSVTLPESPSALKTHLSVSLSCISGLIGGNGLPGLLPAMPGREICEEAKGSVVTAGTLFGPNRDSAEGHQKAASFSARMLLGSVRFDTVAIPILPKYSVAEIDGLCALEESGLYTECVSAHHDKNHAFLAGIATAMEKELKILGVHDLFWERIALFPVCRLGTDFEGYEANSNGCAYSYYMGQLITTDTSYTLFSPYHKWFANLDLDEFVVNEKAYLSSHDDPEYRNAGVQQASKLFDLYDLDPESQNPRMERPGGRLQLRWLDFETKPEETRNISLTVLAHGGIEFVPQASSNVSKVNRTECTQPWKRNSGKPVVSCRKGGFGIRTHSSLGVSDSFNLSTRIPDTPDSFIADIFLYHGKRIPRFGHCSASVD